MKYLLLFILLLTTPRADAQELLGTVSNNNRETLCYASVELMQGGLFKASAVADSVGNYSFKTLEPGYYNVTASYSGYRQREITQVIITQGKKTGLSFALIPDNMQEIHGTITISDNSAVGYFIPEVSMEQKGDDRTITVTKVLNESAYTARYSSNPLNPGLYSVTVSYPGFKSTTIKDVIVSPYKQTELDVRLSVGNTKKPLVIKYKKYLRTKAKID